MTTSTVASVFRGNIASATVQTTAIAALTRTWVRSHKDLSLVADIDREYKSCVAPSERTDANRRADAHAFTGPS